MGNMYHYTSVDGFQGIISNRSIRMTKSDYLNDPSDCLLFITLVEKYLEGHLEIFETSLKKLRVNNDRERDDVEKIYNRGCNLVGYMKYIRGHISLYVLSLSKDRDDMRMWRCYGRGGMQLAFSVEDLTKSLIDNFISDSKDEYLADEDVIYVDPDLGVGSIVVDEFAKFRLFHSSTDKTVFQEHQGYKKKESNYRPDQLYETSSIEKFIVVYMDSYLNTLHYLLHSPKESEEEIAIDMDANEIYKRVYRNVSRLTGCLSWKHDISLYMIMLSVLIKNKAYEYENEHRLVYIEYSDDGVNDREQYLVKRIEPGDFIQPYALFDSAELEEKKKKEKKEKGEREKENFLKDSLRGVCISPSKKTIPIDHDVYMKTLRDFLNNNKFDRDIPVEYSKHDYRW